MNPTRREFLRRIASGAAFVAPVIHTLAAPTGLRAQGMGGGGGTTMDDPMSQKGNDRTMGLRIDPPTGAAQQGSQPPGSTAPWEVVPPGDSGGAGRD